MLDVDGWRSCFACGGRFHAPWCERCGELATSTRYAARCHPCERVELLDESRRALLDVLRRRVAALEVAARPPPRVYTVRDLRIDVGGVRYDVDAAPLVVRAPDGVPIAWAGQGELFGVAPVTRRRGRR